MISVQNLSKVYQVSKRKEGFRGAIGSLFRREWIDKKALNSVSFEVREGEILGLIGANGAGKTTLVKILSGILHSSSGQISVLGYNPWDRDPNFLRQISLVMGQKAQLWWDLPARDGFQLLKDIYEISDEDYKVRLKEFSAALEVEHLLDIQVRRLSLGERMKMELIAALLHQPKLLFLDEPTIGLDISAQKALRTFLLEYKKKFKPIIILTSHYMEDIKSLCERIMIIKEGGVVYDGGLEQVLRKYASHKAIDLTFEENGDAPSEILGYLLEEREGVYRVLVPRDQVSRICSEALKTYKIVDLNIQEEDVANIIESIMRDKKQ